MAGYLLRISLVRCLIALALTSCFYTEPINQRPSIDIDSKQSTAHRGDFVNFEAIMSDPEVQAIELSWSAFLCTDARAPDGCDAVASETGTQEKFAFKVPPVRRELSPSKPVQSLLIQLAAQDAYGARARPDQHTVVDIDDVSPTLTLDATSRYGYVEGIDLDLFATVADMDDGPDKIGPLVWHVFTPSADATYSTTIEAPASTDQKTRTERLMVHAPLGVGQWTFQAIAKDPLGATVMADKTIAIAPDHDPCLQQWSPIAPLDGVNTYPLTALTSFQVPIVNDDLDVYPPRPSDPVLGQTRFTWSIKQPGATAFTALASTANTVDLDPKQYEANDLIELRVQIYDRRNVAITCDPALLTCSTISDPTCIQRLTWRVRVP